MFNKENILFQTKMISDKSEQILWIINWNNFIFNKVILSNKTISNWDNISTAYLKNTIKNQKNLLSLEDILIKAWIIKNDNAIDSDFNFSDIKKDDIISLLA